MLTFSNKQQTCAGTDFESALAKEKQTLKALDAHFLRPSILRHRLSYNHSNSSHTYTFRNYSLISITCEDKNRGLFSTGKRTFDSSLRNSDELKIPNQLKFYQNELSASFLFTPFRKWLDNKK